MTAITDIELVDDLSNGKVDLTYGRFVYLTTVCDGRVNQYVVYSALDIFGGTLVSFEELVTYNAVAKKHAEAISAAP